MLWINAYTLRSVRKKSIFLVYTWMTSYLQPMIRVYFHEVKQFLSKNFDMNDMGETSYVIGIKIHRDRFQGILSLSQETYINKVLERFQMNDCSPSVSHIVKGDKFNLNQCLKNDLERE